MTFKEAEERAGMLLRAGELKQLENFIYGLPERSKNIVILCNLINIFYEEANNNVPFTVFDYSLDFDELIKHYIRVKLLLRRLDFGLPEEYKEELYDYCTATNVSSYFLMHILTHNIFNAERVCAEVNELFNKKAGVTA